MNTPEEIRSWCQETSHCRENLFVLRLRDKGLSNEQILLVLKELDDICHFCFNNNPDCTCMRDE